MKKKTYQFGILAERITILFLRLKGYKILAWRYKTYFGEIDIVASKGKVVAFIEVKARKSEINFEEVVRPRQIQRVKKAAEFFISRHKKLHNHQIRFDLVVVGSLLWPKHYKNFWE
jgi:putative endonuclease